MVLDQITLRRLQLTELGILDEVVRICEKHRLCYFLVGGTLIGSARHGGFIPWDDDIDIGMPRADYDQFITLCKTELGAEYILDSNEVHPSFYFVFAKVRKRNTAYWENAEHIGHFEGYEGIFIDIFPFDAVPPVMKTLKRRRFWIYVLERVKRRKIEKHDSFHTRIKKAIYSFIPIFLVNSALRKVLTKGGETDTHLISWAGMYGPEKETHPKEVILPTTTLNFEGKPYKVPGQWDTYLRRVFGDYMQLPPPEKRETHCIEVKFEGTGS